MADADDLSAFFEEAWRFDFYQAVRVLEGWVKQQRRDAGEPDVQPPATTADPDDEPVRFSSEVTFSFSPSDLVRVEMDPRDGGTPRLHVSFLGLAGARGPLPHFYADLLRRRRRRGDHGMAAFLDIFNHRLVSLLYRLRQQHHPTLHTGAPDEHPFANFLLSFGGAGTPAARKAIDGATVRAGGQEHEGLRTRDLILYAGMLWHRDRSMVGLERLLTHFFGFEFRGEELRGGWLRLADEERTALSVRERNNRLGVTAIAGQRVANPQAGFELSVGPLPWDDFVSFLPYGGSFVALEQLVRYYVRGALDFYLSVSVQAEEVFPNRPALSAKDGPRLGWTSWLMTRPLKGEPAKIRVPGRVLVDTPPPEPED